MIYLFSGLGADERVFEHIDLGNQPKQIIKWLNPQKGETMSLYAQRIIKEQIDNQGDIILIGVSFGGMMAIEVAKLIKPKQLIIISSAKNQYEIPFYYRWLGKLKLDKIIPAQWLKTANFLTFYFFGVHTKSEKRILKSILKDTDTKFLKWAIRQILEWKNLVEIPHLIHIHGDKDKILPFLWLKNVIRIKNGGHLMILDKALEINELLEQHLSK